MEPVGTVGMLTIDRLHLFGVVHVTHHLAGALETDLPDLIVLALEPGVRVHDLHLVARQRSADRTEGIDVSERGARGGGHLGHTVTLQELRFGAVALQEAVQVHFQRIAGALTADGDDLEAVEVDIAHARVVEHGRHVVRDSGQVVRFILVEILGPVVRVEVRDEHDGRTHGERHVHVDERTVHDERNDEVQEHAFLRLQVEDVMVLERDRVHGVVVQHYRLREAGSTAGVRQQRRALRVFLVVDVRHMQPGGDELVPGQDHRVLKVTFVHIAVALEEGPDLFEEREVIFHAESDDVLDADRLCSKQRSVHEDIGGHDDTRPVGAEELDEVLRGGQDVDVVDDGPDLVEGVVADDTWHTGDGQDGDDVPFPDALGQERLRGLVDALEQLAVCDLVPHVVEGI